MTQKIRGNTPQSCACGKVRQTKAKWDKDDMPRESVFEYTTYHMRKPYDCEKHYTLEGIKAIISDIAFCPGGKPDDRRKFIIEPLTEDDMKAYFILQLHYMEPDIAMTAGTPKLQKSREWLITSTMSETEIVETVWAACQRSMYHVTAEWFTYKNLRIYSPHFDVAARQALCEVTKEA